MRCPQRSLSWAVGHQKEPVVELENDSGHCKWHVLMWDACSMHICVWVYVIMWLDSKTIQNSLKIAGLCVPWHLVCRWTSLPGPWRPTWFHDVSWFHARNRTCHTAFETGALFVSHFVGPLWNQRDRLGVGHLGSRNFWFPCAACLLLRSVMNSKEPRLVRLVSSCFPRAVARRLRFKWN